MSYLEDIQIAKQSLKSLPVVWDGKKSILELKDADYNWRQMEWCGFYFEFLCKTYLASVFEVPGEHYGVAHSACFDAKRTINWDFKAKAIKSDDHRAILNDSAAMDLSVKKHDAHGVIMAMCDVEYNDVARTFQNWHTQLKGEKSKYELEREQRTSLSRYRKTRATLQEVLFLILTPENIKFLSTYRQGRNSNGKPRPQKYILDFDMATNFVVDRIHFAQLL